MNPKVSVIVPIYNVEKYLRKCIESIINQSLRDIEIILVDDGSTDSSGIIADEYSKKDNRINVIHKKNGGQGSARNCGIKVANGEYIGFVDSDDWIDLDFYEKLYLSAKEISADISVCSRKIFNEEYILGNVVYVSNEKSIDINKDLCSYIVEQLIYPQTVSTCNKIYLKSNIINNNIKFKNVSEVGSEDALFNYCVLLNSNTVSCVKDTFYNGVERKGSTTRDYTVGAMVRTAGLLEQIYRYSEKNKKDKIGKISGPIMLIFFQQWNYNLIKTFGKNDLKKYIEQEHKLVEDNKYFKLAEKDFVFDKNIKPYIKKMGYSPKGKLFMNIYMILSLLKMNKLAANIRCMNK